MMERTLASREHNIGPDNSHKDGRHWQRPSSDHKKIIYNNLWAMQGQVL